MEYISNSGIETKKISEQFVSHLKGGEVLCLYGNLGAGKTVFVQGMVNYFLPGKRVLSPTFIIVRHYQIEHVKIKRFLHIDLYRMTNIKEIKELEFFEFMHKKDTIVAIEWAEKLENLLPKNRIDISLKSLDDNKRLITIGNNSRSTPGVEVSDFYDKSE